MNAPLDVEIHRRYLDLDAAELPTTAGAQRGVLADLVRRSEPLLATAEVDRVVDRVQARIEGLGPLQPLLDDPAVSEIMVNGRGPVYVERAGRVEATPLLIDPATIEHLIERIVAPIGRRIDRASPTVDARLPDGSRVHAVLPPLAIDGPCLTIRRFGIGAIALTEFASPGLVGLLRWAVTARLNLLVCGGTGAGKTTVLNALAGAIGPSERVITVEDAAELALPIDHVVRLESRGANAEGVGEVTIRDLVRNALRMRPDRIVVGEIRGGEALDMLQAMNTGHEGSLSTCHANGPADALRRVETMVLLGDVDLPLAAVREQVASALDLVIHVARDRSGRRRILAVDEVTAGPGSASLVRDGLLGRLPRRPARDPLAPPPRAEWVGT